MTVHFQIDQVDLGPRGCFSGNTAFNAFIVLGVDTRGKGRDGDVIEAAEVVRNTQFLLEPKTARQLALLGELPDGAEVSLDDNVLLCVAWLRWLAQQAVGARRTHIRWLP